MSLNSEIVFLNKDTSFPNPLFSPKNAPLALGGDLSSKRLISAYESGIFPWFEEGSPPLWWSPDPRCVIFPNEYRVGETLKRFIRKYDTKLNVDFDSLVLLCASRKKTWITKKMRTAYGELFKLGLAHSITVYENDELIGGVYGVSVGSLFCGESMVSLKSNASKVALWALIYKYGKNLTLIDAQVPNPHLLRIGGRLISRKSYLNILNEAKNDTKLFKRNN